MDDDVDCEVLEESPKIELENGSVLYISNIMATVNLGCALHLRTVAQHIQNCEFNMGSRKNTCMLRMRNPSVTAEIFNNGKVRSTSNSPPPTLPPKPASRTRIVRGGICTAATIAA